MDPGLVGTSVDEKYRVDRVLGSGGLGTVYGAWQAQLNRPVAIKVLHGSALADAENKARFEREARSLASVKHENIVSVYSYGLLANGNPYMAMEYLEGKTLADEIKEDGRLSPERTARIAVQVCSALEAAHAAGIVHRDLKPQNIILLADPVPDTVKVLDFGLSRLLPEAAQEAIQKLTQTGALVGSVQYMSPELCGGLPATPATDIYSLGCVVFECISGSPPFNYDNPIGLLHKHRSELPPRLRKDEKSAVPEELELIVFKALEKDATKRFQSMTAFRQALESYLAGKSEDLGQVTMPDAGGRKFNSRTMALVASTAIILGCGLAIACNIESIEVFFADQMIACKDDNLVSLEEKYADYLAKQSKSSLSIRLLSDLLERESFRKRTTDALKAEKKIMDYHIEKGNLAALYERFDKTIAYCNLNHLSGFEFLVVLDKATQGKPQTLQDECKRALLLRNLTAYGTDYEVRKCMYTILGRLPAIPAVKLDEKDLTSLFLTMGEAAKKFPLEYSPEDWTQVIFQVYATTQLNVSGDARHVLCRELFKKAPVGLKGRLAGLIIEEISKTDHLAGAKAADYFLCEFKRHPDWESEFDVCVKSAYAYAAAGQFDKALRSIEKQKTGYGLNIDLTKAQVEVYKAMGRKDKVHEGYAQLLDAAKEKMVQSYYPGNQVRKRLAGARGVVDDTHAGMELFGVGRSCFYDHEYKLAAQGLSAYLRYLKTYDLHPPLGNLYLLSAMMSDSNTVPEVYPLVCELMTLGHDVNDPELEKQIQKAREYLGSIR